jgi:hypothetical protein
MADDTHAPELQQYMKSRHWAKTRAERRSSAVAAQA